MLVTYIHSVSLRSETCFLFSHKSWPEPTLRPPEPPEPDITINRRRGAGLPGSYSDSSDILDRAETLFLTLKSSSILNLLRWNERCFLSLY